MRNLVKPLPRWLAPPVLLLLAAATLSCELWPDQDVVFEPLVDERLPADVLVEERSLEAAKPAAGQRLLRGWRFEDRDGLLLTTAEAGGGRFELVNVTPRERRLVLSLASATAGEARLFHVGRLLDEQAFTPETREIELTLPADLPLGRVALDLELTHSTSFVLEASGFRNVPDDAILQTCFILGRVRFSTHRRNLAALRKPTLVAWALDDPLVEPAIGDALYWAAPAGPRVRFPTGGHNIQATRATELAQALSAWARTL